MFSYDIPTWQLHNQSNSISEKLLWSTKNWLCVAHNVQLVVNIATVARMFSKTRSHWNDMYSSVQDMAGVLDVCTLILLTRLFVVAATGRISICFAIGPVCADSTTTNPLTIHTGNCHLSILRNTAANRTLDDLLKAMLRLTTLNDDTDITYMPVLWMCILKYY